MKRTPILLLALLLVCVCTAAVAEDFRVTLPEDEYIGGAYPQSDGSVIITTYNSVYHALADGTLQQIATQDGLSYPLFSPEGEGFAASMDWEREGIITISHLTESGDWEPVAELDTGHALFGVQSAAWSGGRFYWSMGQEGLPELLICYDPGTREVTGCGNIGILYTSNIIFALDGGIASCVYDNDRDQQHLFCYDPVSGTITDEKLAGIPGVDLRSAVWCDGQFWVIGRNQEDYSTALYAGTGMDKLSRVAESVNAERLVPMGGECLLQTYQALYSQRIVSSAKVKLTISGYENPSDTAFTLSSGIPVSYTRQEPADILNTRDSSVDIIAVSSGGKGIGLKLLKDKHLFTDLSGSEVLTRQVGRMWNSISSHLLTGDSKLVAWPVNLDPMYFDAWLYNVKDEYDIDLPVPTTLPEMLDQIQLLEEEGVFGDYLLPMDIDYSRASLVRYALQRYIEEQAVLGHQLFFDNEELRSLLERIMTEVPEEDPYEWGDESEPVYNMYCGFSSISSEANMPLRVGESSPLALPVYATFLVVNPYSAHQDEAIAYLEYLASQTSESDYLYYRDMTEPMVNPTIQKELDAQEALLAQLQSEEPTAEVREQMEAAQEAIADYQRALYLVSEEDIAAWQAIAESMAVLEEPLCINSDQIVKLIGRLADGNMSVDAFLKGCDDYLRMVYAENQ